VRSSHTLRDALLEGLDNAWDPLPTRLAGITDDEYLWSPTVECWTVHRNGDGWIVDCSDDDPDPAPFTTIAWRCWHIAVDALDSYSARLFCASGTGLTGAEWVGDAVSAQRLLAAAWSTFRTGVADWGDDLFEELGRDWGPFAQHSRLALALHAQREVIHHGAEIALLRDLHRVTVASPGT
jgi:DinB superfamily